MWADHCVYLPARTARPEAKVCCAGNGLHVIMENRTMVSRERDAHRTTIRMLLAGAGGLCVVVIAVLAVIGISRGMTSDGPQFIHLQPDPAVILCSEVSRDNMEFQPVADITLQNSRSDAVEFRLQSMSCGCARLDGLPAVVPASSSKGVRMHATLRQIPSTVNLRAVLEMRQGLRPTGTVLVDQEVSVVSDCQISPSALTCSWDDENPRIAFQRGVTITIHYRGRHRSEVGPEFIGLPPGVQVDDLSIASEEQIGTDLWKAIWNATVEIDRETIANTFGDPPAGVILWLESRVRGLDTNGPEVLIPISMKCSARGGRQPD